MSRETLREHGRSGVSSPELNALFHYLGDERCISYRRSHLLHFERRCVASLSYPTCSAPPRTKPSFVLQPPLLGFSANGESLAAAFYFHNGVRNPRFLFLFCGEAVRGLSRPARGVGERSGADPRGGDGDGGRCPADAF